MSEKMVEQLIVAVPIFIAAIIALIAAVVPAAISIITLLKTNAKVEESAVKIQETLTKVDEVKGLVNGEFGAQLRKTAEAWEFIAHRMPTSGNIDHAREARRISDDHRSAAAETVANKPNPL